MVRTDNQLKAINHDNGNLVVTASAGSGKTSVMIERFLRLVVDRKARVKEILAVTFTKLAAAEMKEKLAKAMKERIAAGDSAEYLKSELDDLTIADISTVDSFCNTVIKRYFYLVGVEPTFSVADDIVINEISSEAVNDVFDGLYEAEDEDFYYLLKVFSNGRNDRKLKNIVLDIFKYASSEAEPEKFFEKSIYNYTDEGRKILENEAIDGLFRFFEPIIERVENAYRECVFLNETKHLDFMKSVIDGFAAAKKDRSPSLLGEFLKTKYAKKAKHQKDSEYSRALSDDLKAIKGVIEKKAEEYGELFEKGEDYQKKSLAALKTVKGLIRLTRLFEEEFTKQKREKNLLDFSDLEHLTCKILENDEVREEIASSYKYIFVDEYQDTNGAQEKIFSLLERDNLFVVGDVKQSIYSFRGSKPEIFIDRAKRAGENSVDLDSNFRSAKKIVEAVNNVFIRAMKKTTCGIDYSKEKMVYGGLYEKEEGLCRIEFCERSEKTVTETTGVYGVLKHLNAKKEEETVGRASLVRRIVEETVGAEYYDEKGRKRRFSFGDVMIVSRNNNYRDIITELIKSGIPVSSEAETGLSDFYEISMLVDILTTVESSARDDVALVSTLKSGVASVSDEELLTIRNAYFGVDFFEAAKLYSKEKTDALAIRLKDFYSYIDRLKLFSAFEGCATLLRRVIDEKKLELSILAMPRGELKIKRVERFLNGLVGFAGEYTLAEFIAKKDSILKKMTVAEPAGEDSVKVMTIHKSKGLEAPVVIVVGMSSKIKGGNQDVIFKNREYGLGVFYYDVENKTRESTFMRKFIALKNADVSLAEETRLLYVALTRAKVRLHVVADSRMSVDKLRAPQDAVKLLDLISPLDMEYVERPMNDVVRDSIVSRREPVIVGEDEDMVKVIRDRISAVYPYENDVKLSLKRTVTDVNKSGLEESYSEEVVRPVIKAADVEHGNAYHKFLELSSLSQEAVEKELTDFYAQGKLSEEDLSVLDAQKLKKIVNNPVFAQLKGYELYREQPFIVSVPPHLIGEKGGSDVLLQGVIDLLAINKGSAVIVDYKFSFADGKTLEDRYKKQLELYAFAVEKILGLKVEKKVLFNINTGVYTEV